MDPADPKTQAQSFETLLATVLETAYGMAYHLTRSSHDAEDLVQEAALSAYRSFHQFEFGTNFRAWYLRILTNAFFAKCRRKKREPQTINLDDVEPLYLNFQTRAAGLHERDEDPATLVIGKMSEEMVSEAIAALPDEFRAVCTLYFLQEFRYQEIGGILDCPVGTVRSRLHRGRRMLQKSLWHVAQEHGIVGELVEQDEA